MWFRDIFRRRSSAAEAPLFDEAFLRRLERLSLQAQRTLRGNPSSGEHPSRQPIASTIFNDHRPYSSGDDLRYVDWNAYARQEQMLVKLGEAEQDVNVHLLLDTSSSMAWGQPPKLRAAQRLVGALGYLALAHNDRLRVLPFAQAAGKMFGPAQGKGRMNELLHFIATVGTPRANDDKARRGTGLTEVLMRHSRSNPRGGIVAICSDLLVTEGLEAGLRALPPPRWQVLVLHLLDPQELRPELQGPLELEDSETGQRLPLTLDAPALAAYRRNLHAWQERIASACARRGATYARVITNWSLEQQVVPYLRARRILT
jgi:uncharacterized protein (DUF58 family)